jgi:hypothetical protein
MKKSSKKAAAKSGWPGKVGQRLRDGGADVTVMSGFSSTTPAQIGDWELMYAFPIGDGKVWVEIYRRPRPSAARRTR